AWRGRRGSACCAAPWTSPSGRRSCTPEQTTPQWVTSSHVSCGVEPQVRVRHEVRCNVVLPLLAKLVDRLVTSCRRWTRGGALCAEPRGPSQENGIDEGIAMRKCFLRTVSLVVCLEGWTMAQASPPWTQAATTGPAPRQLCAMVFDAQRSRSVVFGGA